LLSEQAMTMTDLETLPNIRGWWLVSPGKKPDQLSPRERQILALVTGGCSAKEVAYDLGLSDATVRVLYARAMKKLGRSRRPPDSRV
jgi:DNA-binding NarL/FixJ family response regulator